LTTTKKRMPINFDNNKKRMHITQLWQQQQKRMPITQLWLLFQIHKEAEREKTQNQLLNQVRLAIGFRLLWTLEFYTLLKPRNQFMQNQSPSTNVMILDFFALWIRLFVFFAKNWSWRSFSK
jgi:hypothetical protein